MSAKDSLQRAQKQLEKVQVAQIDPVDWSDLSIYGFLALENAVVAAAEHFRIPWQKTHPSKNEAAQALHRDYGLPNVSQLMLSSGT